MKGINGFQRTPRFKVRRRLILKLSCRYAGQVKASVMASKAVPVVQTARRHGLTAKTVRQSGEVLPFTPISESYRQKYRPQNREERALVEMLAQLRQDSKKFRDNP